MDVVLHEDEWYGLPAWTLESAQLRVTTVPEMGAKLVSIFDRQVQHEWLLSPGNRPFEPVPYGAVFVDQDMSGWDEMFPTINACPYPVAGPYAGNLLPDHGEVWPLAWEVVQAEAGVLKLSVSGRALPYRLSRAMSLVDARTLRLDYEVTNTGDEPLVSLWTAHPQFSVGPDTEIHLPPEIRQVVNVLETEEWGDVGSCHAWPEATTQQRQPFRLDRIGPATEHRCRKFYLLPEQPVSWAELRETQTGAWLRLGWNPDEVPYLGIWVDEGTYNPEPTVALEPSTGFYDSLELAWQNRRAPTLPAGGRLAWHLTVQIGAGLARNASQ
jgi:galactose mutarotase-like enzyme